MDETIKRYFASGPPELTRGQLEDMCAEQAMSFLRAFEPVVLIPRNSAYGYPRGEE